MKAGSHGSQVKRIPICVLSLPRLAACIRGDSKGVCLFPVYLLGIGGASHDSAHAGVVTGCGSSAWANADPMRGENVFDNPEKGSTVCIRVFDLTIYFSILTDARGSGFVHAIANVWCDVRSEAVVAWPVARWRTLRSRC